MYKSAFQNDPESGDIGLPALKRPERLVGLNLLRKWRRRKNHLKKHKETRHSESWLLGGCPAPLWKKPRIG